MNLHPLFVHFPIALLTIYGVMELIGFGFLSRRPEWFYIKYTFAVLGTIASYFAFFSGVIASSLVAKSDLIETHEKMAFLTASWFSVIAFGYLVEFSERIGFGAEVEKTFLRPFWSFCVNIKTLLQSTGLRIFLAIIGLVLITLTGGLGGLIVYGSNADLGTQIIARIFHLQ